MDAVPVKAPQLEAFTSRSDWERWPEATDFEAVSELPVILSDSSSTWLRLRLVNPSGEEGAWALLGRADWIEGFLLDAHRTQTLQSFYWGSRMDLSQLTIGQGQGSNQARIAQLFTLPPGEYWLYLRLGPAWFQGQWQGPRFLDRQTYFEGPWRQRMERLVVYWLLQGMIAFMIIFNLFMYAINRDRAYLYYCLFALCLGEYFMLTVPTDAWLAFHQWERWRGVLFSLISYVLAISFGLFALAFVHTDGYGPRIGRLLQGLNRLAIGVGIASTLYLLLTPIDAQWIKLRYWFNAPVVGAYFLSALYIIPAYLMARNPLARYFGLTAMFIILGGGFFLLRSVYLASAGDISFQNDFGLVLSFQALAVVQLLTFSLSLSYRGRLIARRKEQLEALDRAKSRFFANVSHEFRTPLTLILGPVGQLLDRTDDEQDRAQFRLIRRNAMRLLRLVNQILDLARLDEGKMEINAQDDDLVAYLRQLTMTFSSWAENQRRQLSFASEVESLPARFDADKVEKIATNLISNALKYAQEAVWVRLSLEGQQEICLSVRDDGSGIPEVQIPHLFKRFYQASAVDYATDLPSTGIGLALTSELVELLGGRIEVASEMGQGSVFRVWLPFHPPETRLDDSAFPAPAKAFAAAALAPAVAVQATEGDPQQPDILIIEDQPDVRAYLARCLAGRFRLSLAENGAVGIQRAQEQVPDLVITDLMMPRQDGFAVSRRLKEAPETSHVPIIILTGRASLDSRLEGLEVDADVYLTKPFEAKELLAQVENLLRNRQRLQKRYSQQLLLDDGAMELPDREAQWLQKALTLTTQHMGEEDFGVERLADLMALDRTQLFRKLKALTDQNPSQFISTCRLRRAKQLIEAGEGNLTDIAYAVGFSSPAYFSRVFKQKYGRPPGDFRPAT